MSASTQTAARIAPLEPPYEPAIARTLQRLMPPGVEPLKLFRTVAVNHAVLERFRSTGAYLLNFGTVEPADREVVIHRTCALCGCEYEWGVHATVFGRPLGFSDQQLRASVHGDAGDPAWSDRQRLLVRLADELHRDAGISDGLWRELAAEWTDEQLVELLALAGFYHLVSYLANSCGVELEEAGERFPVE
jgi:alkylhydroperoxidase family enzyme